MVRASFFVTGVLLIGFSGCSCSPTPPPLTTGPASNAGQLFDLIQREDIEGASQLILQDPTVFSASDAPEVFQYSEDEFAALSQTYRTELMSKVLIVVGQVKTVVRGMIEKADQLQADGHDEEAEKYREAVRDFGHALNSDEHLLVFRQMGTAFEQVGKQ